MSIFSKSSIGAQASRLTSSVIGVVGTISAMSLFGINRLLQERQGTYAGKKRSRVALRNKPRASLKRHVRPRPLKHDQKTISKADQI